MFDMIVSRHLFDMIWTTYMLNEFHWNTFQSSHLQYMKLWMNAYTGHSLEHSFVAIHVDALP
jgi:hypothetical protein